MSVGKSSDQTSIFERGCVVYENLPENFALNTTVAELVTVHQKRADDIKKYDPYTPVSPQVISVSDGAPQVQLSKICRLAAKVEMRKAKKGELHEQTTPNYRSLEETQEPEEDSNVINRAPLAIEMDDLVHVVDLAELRVCKKMKCPKMRKNTARL